MGFRVKQIPKPWFKRLPIFLIVFEIVFSYYPINPSLDDLSGPVGDLSRAKQHLKQGQFEAGLSFLIPEARQGNSEAQFILGQLYDTGDRYVDQYPSEFRANACLAAYWFDQAARQEHTGAQAYMAMVYHYGKGVVTDPEKAYLWLAVSGLTQHPDKLTGIFKAIYNELSLEARAEIEATLASWEVGKEPPAQIYYLPSSFLISEIIYVFTHVSPCGYEDSWLL